MKEHILSLAERNTVTHVLVGAGLAAAVFGILLLLRTFMARRLSKIAAHTATKWDDIFVDVFSSTKSSLLLVFSLLAGTLALGMTAQMKNVFIHLLFIVLIVQGALWGGRFIQSALALKAERDRLKGAAAMNYSIISYASRLAMWSVVILLVLSNLGVNVTTLVASLGIGGVAVALAVQNILGDLFASLSIVLDKPFEVGDSLTVGELTGTVKDIGLKTTRLTSITGEELVFANSDLLGSRIHNYKKMQERRIVYTLGVEFDTPIEKLHRIGDIVRDIFAGIGHTRLDRVHFSRISQSTLDFEVVYYVGSANYNLYMDVQEAFNFAVLERFAAEGISFAYPTQTLQIQGDPGALALAAARDETPPAVH